jgi:uncharacterized integral membrane protein
MRQRAAKWLAFLIGLIVIILAILFAVAQQSG